MSVRAVDAAQWLRGSLPACVVRGRSPRTPRRALVARAPAHGVAWGRGVAAGGGGGGGHPRSRRCVCGVAGDDDANITTGDAAASSSAGDTLSALDAMLGMDAAAEASETTARVDADITGMGDAVSSTLASSSSSSSRTNAGDTLSALDAMLGIDPEAEAAEKAAAAAAEAARQKRRQEAEAARTTAAPSGVPPREKRMGTVQGALTEEDEKKPARANAASGKTPAQEQAQGMWARWDIPWDGWSVLLGMVGVEVAYVLASIIAPVMVLVNYTDVDRLPPADLPTDAAAASSAVTPVRELSGTTESELAAAALSAPPAYLDGIVGAEGAADGLGESQQISSYDESADTLYRMLVSLLESDQYYKVLGAEVLFQLFFGSLMLILLLFGHYPFQYPLFHYSLREPFGPGDDNVARSSSGTPGGATPSTASVSNNINDNGGGGGGGEWLRTALVGAGGALALTVMLTWLSAATGIRGAEQGAASNSIIEKALTGGLPGLATLFVTTAVAAPMFEELVFRGFLLTSLTKWLPTPAAVVMSSIVFALIHQQSSGDTVQLLALGLCAGAAYCKTRNLATPMLIHATYNGTVLVLYLLWVST